jgi:hypothetical protein
VAPNRGVRAAYKAQLARGAARHSSRNNRAAWRLLVAGIIAAALEDDGHRGVGDIGADSSRWQRWAAQQSQQAAAGTTWRGMQREGVVITFNMLTSAAARAKPLSSYSA